MALEIIFRLITSADENEFEPHTVSSGVLLTNPEGGAFREWATKRG
jgi:hypothetical protein